MATEESSKLPKSIFSTFDVSTHIREINSKINDEET